MLFIVPKFSPLLGWHSEISVWFTCLEVFIVLQCLESASALLHSTIMTLYLNTCKNNDHLACLPFCELFMEFKQVIALWLVTI